MKIEEIIDTLKIYSIGVCSREEGVAEDDKAYFKTCHPSLYMWVLKDFFKSFFDEQSIKGAEINLKKMKEILKNNKIKHETYKEYYRESNSLLRQDVFLVSLREFYDRANILQNERKEIYKKDMQEVKNFSLVNKNYFNDFLCFLGNEMFPNHASPQNGYELLPGILRKSFFSKFILTSDFLKKDLQIDYKDYLRQ